MKALIQKLDPNGNIRGFTALALIVVLLAWAVIYKESNPAPIPQVTITEIIENKENYLNKTVYLEAKLTYLETDKYTYIIGDTRAHGKRFIYEVNDGTGTIRGEDSTGFSYNGLNKDTVTSGDVYTQNITYLIRGRLNGARDGSDNLTFYIDEITDAP